MESGDGAAGEGAGLGAAVSAAAVMRRLTERDLLPLMISVAAKRHVPMTDIVGRGREASVVAARHEVWGWLEANTEMSIAEMARLFEVNHTSILYALGRLAAKRAGRKDALSRAVARGTRTGVRRALGGR